MKTKVDQIKLEKDEVQTLFVKWDDYEESPSNDEEVK